MYNIGSAFHTTCLLLHFPPLLSAPAFSTPAFSVAPTSPLTLSLNQRSACDDADVVMSDAHRQVSLPSPPPPPLQLTQIKARLVSQARRRRSTVPRVTSTTCRRRQVRRSGGRRRSS